jgi:RNA polymerase sigma factor (sigma-70 family)
VCDWHLFFALIFRGRRLSARNPEPASPVEASHPHAELLYNQNRGLPFSAWLYRIAHNLVANWHRDNSRRPEVPLDESVIVRHHWQEHPEHALLKSQDRDRLLRLIRCLPPDRQQLLILKFVDHLSNAEIGQIMGKTEGAVKSLYHRTLLSLRYQLQEIISEDTQEGQHR